MFNRHLNFALAYPALFAVERDEEIDKLRSPAVVAFELLAAAVTGAVAAAAVVAEEEDVTLLIMASPTRLNSEGSRGTRAGGTPAYAQRLSGLVLISSGFRW